MVNVNDVRNVDGQVRGALDKLDAALDAGEIEAEEHEAIRACWSRLKRTEWSKPLTQRDRLGQLRRSAVRTDRPLIDFEEDAHIDQALDAHADAGAASDSAQASYSAALTVFFEFLDGEPEWPSYEWVEDFDPPEREQNRKKPDEMLDEAEVVAIRKNCDHARAKAAVELMADVGTRAAATCQLRTGDLDLDADPPTVRLNPEGRAQKGAENHLVGRVDLKDSVRHIKTYVREWHPEGPEPPANAPLFALRRGYDPDAREECAASPRTLQDQIDKAAERAGIEKPTGHHSFKHACVKRLRWKYDLNWDEIANRVLWSEESIQEMMQRYGRLDEDERRAKIRSKMGISEPSDDGPSEVECATCGTTLSPSVNYCDQCGSDPHAPPGGGRDSEFREAVRETVYDVLGIEDLDDIELAGERAAAGRKVNATLARDDDLPDPDPLADLMAELEIEDLEELEEIELTPADEGGG